MKWSNKLKKTNPTKILKAGAKLAKTVSLFAVDYAVAVVLVLVLAVCALKLPEGHNKYLHSTVGKKVYMIRDSYNSGGGTGFAVKAPSGQSYILTNDHVCEVSKDGRTVLVTGSEGSVRRRIIAHDEYSDLCLIEGMPGVEGLEVANKGPSRGDMLYVVGHPHLMPKHVSSGEVTGAEDVRILLAPISVMNPSTGKEEQIDPERGGMLPDQCSLPKHSIQIINMNFFFWIIKVKYCVLTVKDAYVTGITIFPGNSGSPMVNMWGSVEGVVFASDDTNWGRIVPIQDVKAFLKNY